MSLTYPEDDGTGNTQIDLILTLFISKFHKTKL